jgi:hypothetical protein
MTDQDFADRMALVTGYVTNQVVSVDGGIHPS